MNEKKEKTSTDPLIIIPSLGKNNGDTKVKKHTRYRSYGGDLEIFKAVAPRVRHCVSDEKKSPDELLPLEPNPPKL